jgi:amino acid permease
MAPPSSSPTPLSNALNLFIAAAGAGLLSFPFAIASQGILLGSACTLLFALISGFTDFVFIQSSALFRARLQGAFTFEGLVGAAIGPRSARFAGAAVVLGTLGGLVGFFIILGDMSEEPLRHALGCSAAPASSSGAVCSVLARRALLIPSFALTVVLPLASLPSMAHLQHSSLLGALTVFVVSGVIAAKGAAALSSGQLSVVGSTGSGTAEDDAEALVLARLSFTPLMLGIPIAIFSLGNHMQMIPVFLESRPGSAASRNIGASVAAAVGTCVLLYLATGILGYAAFRSAVKGDVLLNLPLSDPASDIAKGFLALHILAAFPVLVFPARQTLRAWAAALLRGRGGRAAGGAAGAGGGQEESEEEEEENEEALEAAGAAAWAGSGSAAGAAAEGRPAAGLWRRFLAWSVASPLPAAALLVLSTSSLSVLFPQVSVVFGLVGATCATYEIHTVPGQLLLLWADALEGKLSPALYEAAAAAAGGRGLQGREETWASAKALWAQAPRPAPAAAVRADSEPLLQLQQEGEAAAAEEGVQGQLQWQRHPPHLLPHLLSTQSPALLRAQGWALIVLSVLVAVIGTGTYVYSTWLS